MSFESWWKKEGSVMQDGGCSAEIIASAAWFVAGQPRMGRGVFLRKVTCFPTGINNPHKRPPLEVKVFRRETPYGYEYLTDGKHAHRIQKHFCGVSGCNCGNGHIEELCPGIFKLRFDFVLQGDRK